MHPIRPILATLAMCALGSAQDDLRDVLTLENGREVRGRVVQPNAADQLMVVQGGKRVRVPRKQVKQMDLVRDRIDEFFTLRLRMRGQSRAQWMLIEWATSRGLTSFAQLQAMLLALETDDARAHEFLGHRERKGVWQWPHDDRWYAGDHLEREIIKSPIDLRGERFSLRTDGDLRAGIRALLDLERMAAWWYAEFGADLELEEMIEPAVVVAGRDAQGFGKWGFSPVPFYTPDPHGDEARTFYAGARPQRPQLLFYVGSQALLYHAMIGSVDSRDSRDRVCAWLEVGLAMMAEQTFSGDPGYAEPGAPRTQDLQALQALGRDYRLTHLLHLPMYGGFYLLDDTPTAINWSAAAMFVQFLLLPDNRPATREDFLAYVVEALARRKGDSSTLFDSMMHRRVEDFETPFRVWLKKVAGI